MNDFFATERGNTMLSSGTSMVAWITIEGVKRLEVCYAPDNYPALNVNIKDFTDEELAKHINENLDGWFVHKNNLDTPLDIDQDGAIVWMTEEKETE